ncbi:MAG TPA: hypothetical protein VGL40_02735 [Bacillota bacterium]|jgi:hypothetical protein
MGGQFAVVEKALTRGQVGDEAAQAGKDHGGQGGAEDSAPAVNREKLDYFPPGHETGPDNGARVGHGDQKDS